MIQEKLVKGVVRWWDDELHRGQIRSEDGADYFVDFTGIMGRNALYENEEVLFKEKDDKMLGGKRAYHVTSYTGVDADW